MTGHGDRFRIDSEHCVGVPGGNHGNGTTVVYEACTENSPKWLSKPWQ
ncbi:MULTISPECIES: hypothetical protein [Streptomyces]|nr:MULTISPECIES: hypothetical protein [Streptomyces]